MNSPGGHSSDTAESCATGIAARVNPCPGAALARNAPRRRRQRSRTRRASAWARHGAAPSTWCCRRQPCAPQRSSPSRCTFSSPRPASVTRGSHSTNLFLLAAGVALLYGGEFLEVIRFMEPETAELEPAEKEYVQQLAAAVGALQRVPLVTKVSLFDKPGNLNETGVRVNLDSAFVSQLSRRQFQTNCSEKPGREGRKGPPTASKPTFTLLRRNIERKMSSCRARSLDVCELCNAIYNPCLCLYYNCKCNQSRQNCLKTAFFSSKCQNFLRGAMAPRTPQVKPTAQNVG